jgi:hypothetical protein
MKTTFLRAVVRSAPSVIYQASAPVNVSVWACSERSAEGSVAANGLVRISTHLKPENDWHAPALPFNAYTPKFRMETGEKLYAISNDESEVGIMIEEID